MRFYWLRDRINQKQFVITWAAGKTNKADYYTKHHPIKHHKKLEHHIISMEIPHPSPKTEHSSPHECEGVLIRTYPIGVHIHISLISDSPQIRTKHMYKLAVCTFSMSSLQLAVTLFKYIVHLHCTQKYTSILVQSYLASCCILSNCQYFSLTSL